MGFSVERRALDKAIVRLVVSGDLDATAGPVLRQAIHDALATDGLKGIVIDLDGTAVVDEAGIRAIERGHRAADRADVPLLVLNARSDRTRSILDTCGILATASRS